MREAIDLTGRKINRWLVIGKSHQHTKSGAYWLCRCDCGIERMVRGTVLKSALSMSCGCYAREMTTKNKTKIGRNTSEYGIYYGMLTRCDNENTDNYRNYGGRGIVVCERWRGVDGFDNFMADMGPRPSIKHTLDRYPDNENGNYEPTNCRWATQKQQMRNVRYNVWIEFEGERMILADWALFLGVSEEVISRHLKTKTQEEAMKYVKYQFTGMKKICIGRYENGILIESYNSVKEIDKNGFGVSSVYGCLRGKQGTYRGFTWKYIEEPIQKTA